ncbi:ATP synthase subunit I [Acidiferrimicrobium sp. IK]|uniref:ATP synthase subunit I n=1 Tax=Acidiferrimicrobium sp. IK TaxID=2871700 RepID=UPI0021CB961F|nr:ATP synthase subunit I [Acidiferrimicrobium sp. IK]MCU4186487.1 ATP synthase subunit I [Acidiferrimicrobium sp. IK]
MASAFATGLDIPPVERQIARDMARRALPVAPVLILIGGTFWGWDGALAAAYGVGLIVTNFLLAAGLLAWGARRGAAALAGAALGGFLLRLILLGVAVFAVHPFWHFPVIPLCITLLVTHLGLLFWEMRYVSATLANPGLKPNSEFHFPTRASRRARTTPAAPTTDPGTDR